MQRLERSALVRCSCEQMYEVINDVARYPEFVPGCSAAEVLSEVAFDPPAADAAERELVASMALTRGGFRETLTTRNRCFPARRIQLSLVSGPLVALDGEWLLEPLGELGCEVRLHLRFELRRGLNMLSRAVSGSLARVADEVLDAFCRRAEMGRA